MMTEVVLNSSPTITPENTDFNLYYGVLINGHLPGKGFISQDRFDIGEYKVKSVNAVTRGNEWDLYNDSYLVMLIRTLLRNKHQVFQFNTSQELFTWLGQ